MKIIKMKYEVRLMQFVKKVPEQVLNHKNGFKIFLNLVLNIYYKLIIGIWKGS